MKKFFIFIMLLLEFTTFADNRSKQLSDNKIPSEKTIYPKYSDDKKLEISTNLIAKKEEENNMAEKEVYMDLRNLLLTGKRLKGDEESEKHEVYAVLVDNNNDGEIWSLACMADGNCSYYFKPAGGMLGMGQKDKEIENASKAFVYSSEQVLPILKKTDQYDLPKNNERFFYLVTDNGVYKAVSTRETADQEPKEIQFLNFLFYNVSQKIKESKSVNNQ